MRDKELLVFEEEGKLPYKLQHEAENLYGILYYNFVDSSVDHFMIRTVPQVDQWTHEEVIKNCLEIIDTHMDNGNTFDDFMNHYAFPEEVKNAVLEVTNLNQLMTFLNNVEIYMQLSDDANRYEYSDDEYLEDMKMAEYEEIKGNKGAIERTEMHYAELNEAAAEVAHNLSVFEERISSSLEDVLYAASNLTMRDLQLFRASKEYFSFKMSDSIQETVQEIKDIAEMEEQEEMEEILR